MEEIKEELAINSLLWGLAICEGNLEPHFLESLTILFDNLVLV